MSSLTHTTIRFFSSFSKSDKSPALNSEPSIRAKNADKVMKHLYQEPFITIKGVSHLLGVTHQSASSLVKQLMADGILTGVTKLKRNQVYGFERYVRLFMD